MASGREAQKSKEVTWSERDLAKHILRDKKKTPSAGPSKTSSPRTGRGKPGSVSGKSSLGSSAPVDRASSKKRERERPSPSATATSSRANSRSSEVREGRVSGQEGKKRGEVVGQRERERPKDSSGSSGRMRSSGGGITREQGRHTTRREESRDGGRGGRSSERGREERGHREREKKVEPASNSSSFRENKKVKNERKPYEGATPQPMVEVRVEDGEEVVEEEEFEYEEEFEDDEEYNDEDFEEDVEEESESESETNVAAKIPVVVNSDPSSHINLVEIMEAINAENQNLAGEREGEGEGEVEGLDGKLVTKPNVVTTPTEVMTSASLGSLGSQRSMTKRKFVDFSSAKKMEESERIARVTRKRGQELLSMIELDVVTFDLFELQPLTEYELYMRNFGSEGTQQVACQTGEDTVEVEVQTELVEEKEVWVQWPPEDLKGYGGRVDEDEEDVVTVATGGSSAVRLASFLKRASQVMSVLLEDNVVLSGQSPFHTSQSHIPFCSSWSRIPPPSQLQGCTLTSMEYSPIHPHLVMTLHTPTPEACLDAVPVGGGAVCVWSTREPSQPQYLLVCHSAPTCGCFSGHKTTMVLSGNDDGTIVVWDLREPVAMHTRPPGCGSAAYHGLIPRVPTFSTAALPQKHNHRSPVTSITTITSTSTTSTLHTSPLTNDTENEAMGLSFQLASLDRSGLLNIWVAVETKPHPQGSESDLGLVPGGRVKLVWTTSLDTVRASCPSSIPVQTVCIQFHPMDTNHLFLGTDEGTVIHQTRYGRRPIPRQYRSQFQTTHCPCDVTSLSFSPWQPDYFLASYSNGNISLHHTKKCTYE